MKREWCTWIGRDEKFDAVDPVRAPALGGKPFDACLKARSIELQRRELARHRGIKTGGCLRALVRKQGRGVGISGRCLSDRRFELREPCAPALYRVEARGEIARKPGQLAGLDAMLARHCAQFKEARLGGLEALGVIFHRASCLVELRFRLVRVDDRAIEAGKRFGEEAMVAREPIETPRRAAQQRGATRAPVESFEYGLKVARDLLALLHRGARLGEFGFLARLRGKRGELGHAMFEPFAISLGLAHRRLRRGKLRFGRAPCGVALRHRACASARIGVEQRTMPSGSEQAPVVMLTVNLDKMCADLAQQRC